MSRADDDARAIGDLFEKYVTDVKAIAVPEQAQAARDDLARVADFGTTLMANVAGTFGKNEMQDLLDEFWPKLTAELSEAEDELRAALNL